jgi:hypothetical protein
MSFFLKKEKIGFTSPPEWRKGAILKGGNVVNHGKRGLFRVLPARW